MGQKLILELSTSVVVRQIADVAQAPVLPGVKATAPAKWKAQLLHCLCTLPSPPTDSSPPCLPPQPLFPCLIPLFSPPTYLAVYWQAPFTLQPGH